MRNRSFQIPPQTLDFLGIGLRHRIDKIKGVVNGLQQSETMVVPLAMFSWIRGMSVSLERSSTAAKINCADSRSIPSNTNSRLVHCYIFSYQS